jgi:2-oxoisovalerate dehydrogenase E2 component (dihydrolipoyl transacylase)
LAVEDSQDSLLTTDSSEIVTLGGSKQGTENLLGALSTPAVRNLAKDLGIDINVITGTGKDGRVLKEDVLRFSDQKGFVTDSVSSEHAVIGGDSVSTKASSNFEDKTVPLRYAFVGNLHCT